MRLRAALENLIDNAVKFTERGSVGFAVGGERPARGRVRLTFTVADSGIGLTPAEIRRLFRPFAQASEEIARRYGGAGLGLAFVKRIAKAMGGDLTVTSEPGPRQPLRGSRVSSLVGRRRRRADDAGGGRAPWRCVRWRSLRRGQSLWPGRAQHHPDRARPSRRFRRHAARRRSRRSPAAATMWC